MLSLPPLNPLNLTPGTVIAKRLETLVGQPFELTGKSRTDGSNIRKAVTSCLEPHYDNQSENPNIVMMAEKGIPKIKREMIDTYVVTTGNSYNLQVWNRIPNSEDALIEYKNGDCLTCADVRLVFVKVDTEKNAIESIVVTTPSYIENHFGKFGVPTIKWQLIISDSKRQEILSRNPPVLVEPDFNLDEYLNSNITYHSMDMFDEPQEGEVASIQSLEPVLINNLIGKTINPAATKNRGQTLEYSVISLLDYDVSEDSVLAGGYPDLPNQALEIKIQDSPTVDLGKYSPQFETEVYSDLDITTESIRYLIALMNKETNEIEGFILVPGKSLGEHFSYVADKNFKCQRSIPMSFFEEHKGKSIYIE
ncbi:hypothetical protein [Parvibacter caecicola]|uniref:hypothetical protein n=1 Tax=Parvibacter caecicola TaxID=747645 RepID=UPI002731782C|nr:hypothetical protein [Parvibacter caecicola]